MKNESYPQHPTPEQMSVDAYPDGARAESVPLDVKRTYYAFGVAAERARIAAALRELDQGDWLLGRLRALVASME